MIADSKKVDIYAFATSSEHPRCISGGSAGQETLSLAMVPQVALVLRLLGIPLLLQSARRSQTQLGGPCWGKPHSQSIWWVLSHLSFFPSRYERSGHKIRRWPPRNPEVASQQLVCQGRDRYQRIENDYRLWSYHVSLTRLFTVTSRNGHAADSSHPLWAEHDCCVSPVTLVTFTLVTLTSGFSHTAKRACIGKAVPWHSDLFRCVGNNGGESSVCSQKKNAGSPKSRRARVHQAEPQITAGPA